MSTAKKLNPRTTKAKAPNPEPHLKLVPPVNDGTVAYACRSCGKKNTVRGSAEMNGVKAIECPHCAVVAVHPLPTAKMVKEQFALRSSMPLSDFAKNELVYLQSRIADMLLQMQAHRKAPAFLDFGFGNGAFLRHLNAKGVKVFGVEMDTHACSRLAQATQNEPKKPTIINASEESYTKRLANKRFNCITMFQVLDYVADPLKTVKELSELQKSGDILYIECANEKSIAVKVKNFFSGAFYHRAKFYGSLNPPEKFHGFNKQSLAALLERAGYEVKELRNYAFRDGVHELESTEHYPNFGEWMELAGRFSVYNLARTFIGMFDNVFAKFGRGGGLYVIAAKKPSDK